MYYRQFSTAINSAFTDLFNAVTSCSSTSKEHKKSAYWKLKLTNSLDTIIKLQNNYPEHARKFNDLAQHSLPLDVATYRLKLLDKAVEMVKTSEHRKFLSNEIHEIIDMYPHIKTSADATAIPKTPEVVTAPGILEAGAKHMRDRGIMYDKPEGERSMAKVVEMFNLLYDQNLTETQGWRFMLILKLVRSTQGKLKLDNFEDAVAYEALAAEAAAKGK